MRNLETPTLEKEQRESVIIHAKKNNSFVYIDNLKSDTQDQIDSILQNKEKTERNEELKTFLSKHSEYFTKEEIQKITRDSLILGESVLENFKRNLNEKEKIEKTYSNLALKYNVSLSSNPNYKKLHHLEKKAFLNSIKKLEKLLYKNIEPNGLTTLSTIEKTIKKELKDTDITQTQACIEDHEKLFKEEKEKIVIFSQFSKHPDLPYKVLKMSEASKNYYLSYYKEQDIKLKKTLIKDWQIIVNHEEVLLKKLLEIFKHYPEEKNNKILEFQALDFIEKENFIKNAEILYPQKKVEKSLKTPEVKNLEKTNKKAFEKKNETKEEKNKILEEKCIKEALLSLANGRPEDGLKALLNYKRKVGNTEKIKFHIKMLLNYIEEMETNEVNEKEIKLKEEEENNKITNKIEELIKSISLKKIIKQEKFIAESIKNAMINEALHKGEKDALKRKKTENLKTFSRENEKEITRDYYKNEKDNFIDRNGFSKKIQKINVSKKLISSSNETIDISKQETDKNSDTFVSNFYFNNEIISSKKALNLEKEKLTNLSSFYSKKIINDIGIKNKEKQLNLVQILKDRLLKETKLTK